MSGRVFRGRTREFIDGTPRVPPATFSFEDIPDEDPDRVGAVTVKVFATDVDGVFALASDPEGGTTAARATLYGVTVNGDKDI